MSDYALQRLNMVESQVRPSDLTDRRITRAMLALPREAFVPHGQRAVCYTDIDLPLEAPAPGRAAAAPRVVLAPRLQAKLIQLLQVPDDGRVLDIAAGLGYSTAILSEMAASVVGIEPDAARVVAANAALKEQGAENARVIEGNLTDGLPDDGPYDCILLNGAVEMLPDTLLDQLKDGGRLVAVHVADGVSRGTEWRRHGGQFSPRAVFDAQTHVLPGFQKAAEFVF
ncbi:MAG: protein-L-isoaspartate O-methyltransferase [Pseudomonadota bacterium]